MRDKLRSLKEGVYESPYFFFQCLFDNCARLRLPPRRLRLTSELGFFHRKPVALRFKYWVTHLVLVLTELRPFYFV